jgi:hypothetical protein
MAANRDYLIEQIRAELKAGTYRPNLDRIAAAALAHLSKTESPEEFSAVVFLAERTERALAVLALAERGIPAVCFHEDTSLEELVARAPALVVADTVLRAGSILERALPEAVLLLMGDRAESPHVRLPRPLTLLSLQSAVEAVAPARLPRRALTRALVVGRDAALVRALRGAGCEVVSTADAVELFVLPPIGTFDAIFAGPELAADGGACDALARIYGPGLVILPA